MRPCSLPFLYLLLVLCSAAISCGSNGPTAIPGTGGSQERGTGGGGAPGGEGGAAGQGVQGGGNGGSAFTPVQTIFDNHCVFCHDPAHPLAGDNPTFVEMPLVSGQSYDALVGVAARETCGATRVVPGDPEHSYLYRKIADDNPCDGDRMPRAGATLPQPLSADQITTIHDWIAAGARP